MRDNVKTKHILKNDVWDGGWDGGQVWGLDSLVLAHTRQTDGHLFSSYHNAVHLIFQVQTVLFIFLTETAGLKVRAGLFGWICAGKQWLKVISERTHQSTYGQNSGTGGFPFEFLQNQMRLMGNIFTFLYNDSLDRSPTSVGKLLHLYCQSFYDSAAVK